MSPPSTFMFPGFSSIAVRNAAILYEPLRRLPQMPSTEMLPASLIVVLRWGCRGCATVNVAGRARQGAWGGGRRCRLFRRADFLELQQQQDVVRALDDAADQQWP